jgi:hypothetical protein
MSKGAQRRKSKSGSQPRAAAAVPVAPAATAPIPPTKPIARRIADDMGKGGFLMFVIALLSLMVTAYGTFRSQAQTPPVPVAATPLPMPAIDRYPAPCGSLKPEFAIEVRPAKSKVFEGQQDDAVRF